MNLSSLAVFKANTYGPISQEEQITSDRLDRHSGKVDGRWNITKEEDVELEIWLKTLNKPPVKTFIKGRHNIIDCVNIYEQPTFNHPSLLGHKIQMRPTFDFKELGNNTLSMKNQLGVILDKVHCPKGTVPIRRTRKQDLLRAKSYQNLHPSNIRRSDRHIAYVSIESPENLKFRGVHGVIDVYELTVIKNQRSYAKVMIENYDDPTPLNSMEAGWMALEHEGGYFPELYVKLITDNNEIPVCMNTECGFVQVDKQVYVGAYIRPQSLAQLDMTIFQDIISGNWWVRTQGGVNIGYWPKPIVPNLAEGAEFINWGGSADGDKIYPPMGSGSFPIDNNPCYISEMKSVSSPDGFSLILEDPVNTVIRVSHPACYNVEYTGDMAFGGPGGACGD